MSDLQERVGFLLWLLKDFGWTLIMFNIAIPAGVLSVAVECINVGTSWKTSTSGEKVHGLAVTMWICGNFVWMMDDFLFDPVDVPGVRLPWHKRPIWVNGSGQYNLLLTLSRMLLLCAVMTTFGYYLYVGTSLLIKRFYGSEGESLISEAPDVKMDVVFGYIPKEIYVCVYITPWILKDCLWTVQMLWPGLFFGLVAFAVVAHCYWKYRRHEELARCIWVLCNALWLIGEVGLSDMEVWPRYVSACVLLLPGSLVAVDLWARLQETRVECIKAGPDGYMRA